jgi:hypothetical protein
MAIPKDEQPVNENLDKDGLKVVYILLKMIHKNNGKNSY